MALLWSLAASSRSTQFWTKVDDSLSAYKVSFYPRLYRGFDSSPIIYVFTSLWSRWLYGGETVAPLRRAEEYISRILQGPVCSTPQPFFALIHRHSSSRREIAWRLSHWTLVPISLASSLRATRLWEERHFIRTMQCQLNPPLVYGLLTKFLGISWGVRTGGNAVQFKPELIRISRGRPLCCKRALVHRPAAGKQLSIVPRACNDSQCAVSQLAVAAAGLLKEQAAKPTYELWHADGSTLLQVWRFVVKYFAGHRRTRALKLLHRICASRTGSWLLPVTEINISMPWLGDGPPRLAMHSILRRFMRTLNSHYSGVFPMFELSKLRIKLSWSSSLSLGDILSSSKRWAKRHHLDVWPCACHNFGQEWPRARSALDGPMHVCAGSSEIPWPADHAWVKTWSCGTRLRPSAQDALRMTQNALLKIAKQRRIDTVAAVHHDAAALAEELADIASHHWRLRDLCLPEVQDAGAARDAAAFLDGLWTEVRDHANHEIQAICPALALAAIHKSWEYGSWSNGAHFVYGDLHSFGFRDLPHCLEYISEFDWLPAHLQPSRLASRRRQLWNIGKSRTLPKNSDPAAAHRPLCNRTAVPTAELDSILCRAGVALLRLFDPSEHLDIDDPKQVLSSFDSFTSKLHDTLLQITDDNYDMKGCFTHIPQEEAIMPPPTLRRTH